MSSVSTLLYRALLFTVFVFTIDQSALANILYDSFGPGNSFHPYIQADIDPSGSIADRFTVGSEDSFFDAVELPLWGGNSDPVDVTVWSSDPVWPNGLPGTRLETISFDKPETPYPARIYTLRSNTHPLLRSHQNYWLSIDLRKQNQRWGHVYWSWASTKAGNDTPTAYRQYPGAWQASSGSYGSAFRVTGIPASSIPEPGTWGFLILGGMVVFLRRRSPTH